MREGGREGEGERADEGRREREKNGGRRWREEKERCCWLPVPASNPSKAMILQPIYYSLHPLARTAISCSETHVHLKRINLSPASCEISAHFIIEVIRIQLRQNFLMACCM